MKRTIIAVLSAIILLLGGYTVVNDNQLGYQTIDVYKVGTSLTVPAWLEPTQDSTSTDAYVYTTSKTISTKNVKEVDMNLAFTASTSAVLTWTFWFSDDGDNWFSEDGNTDTSGVVMTHGATQLVHSWTPGVTTQVLKHVEAKDNIANINTNFLKITFDVTTASGSLYAEINTKQ